MQKLIEKMCYDLIPQLSNLQDEDIIKAIFHRLPEEIRTNDGKRFKASMHILVGMAVSQYSGNNPATSNFLKLCSTILCLSFKSTAFIKYLRRHYSKNPYTFPREQYIAEERIWYNRVFYPWEDQSSDEHLQRWVVYAAFHLWKPLNFFKKNSPGNEKIIDKFCDLFASAHHVYTNLWPLNHLLGDIPTPFLGLFVDRNLSVGTEIDLYFLPNDKKTAYHCLNDNLGIKLFKKSGYDHILIYMLVYANDPAGFFKETETILDFPKCKNRLLEIVNPILDEREIVCRERHIGHKVHFYFKRKRGSLLDPEIKYFFAY